MRCIGSLPASCPVDGVALGGDPADGAAFAPLVAPGTPSAHRGVDSCLLASPPRWRLRCIWSRTVRLFVGRPSLAVVISYMEQTQLLSLRCHGPPVGTRAPPRVRANPAISREKSCARVDSNHHGEISPQGPQPCASTNSATGAGAPSIAPARLLPRPAGGSRCIRPRPAIQYEHMFVVGRNPSSRGAMFSWI